VIRADDAPAAAARSVEQARRTVAADIVEAAHIAVGAAHDEQRLAEKVERVEVAGVRDVAHVTHDLPRGAQHELGFEREELRIAVGPGGQAVVVGVRILHAAKSSAASCSR
jgi:hypothetical protein